MNNKIPQKKKVGRPPLPKRILPDVEDKILDKLNEVLKKIDDVRIELRKTYYK